VSRILLVLTVALVMAVMMVAMAMPVFAQAADPCTTGIHPPRRPMWEVRPKSHHPRTRPAPPLGSRRLSSLAARACSRVPSVDATSPRSGTH